MLLYLAYIGLLSYCESTSKNKDFRSESAHNEGSLLGNIFQAITVTHILDKNCLSKPNVSAETVVTSRLHVTAPVATVYGLISGEKCEKLVA